MTFVRVYIDINNININNIDNIDIDNIDIDIDIDIDNIDSVMFLTILISLNNFRVKNSITIRNKNSLKNNNLCKEHDSIIQICPFFLISLLRCFFSCNFIFFTNHYLPFFRALFFR